jgi:hypothetical protein
MNDLDLIFLLFLCALSGIVVGIFIGFGMGQQPILKQLGGEYADRREDVKQRAFARLEKAEASATVAIKHTNILDAEVIE